MDKITQDDLLGGAVRLYQPRDGYRIGMDTILLAAAVPAAPGNTVLEPGTGTGGAALCLAHRVKGVHITGIDTNTDHLALAKKSIALNGLGSRITLAEGDINRLEGDGSRYDHVMINPPYLPAGSGREPKGAGKSGAHIAHSAPLKAWIRYAVHQVKARGSITLIHRADQLDQAIAALSGPCGDLTLLPLWPREGRPASRIILQAFKGTKGAFRLLPGLILHSQEARYSKEASHILAEGGVLDMKGFALWD